MVMAATAAQRVVVGRSRLGVREEGAVASADRDKETVAVPVF